MQNGIKSVESTLRLPMQAAPINRSMTNSSLAGDSGVEPSILLTAGLIALLGWLAS
jgi:hypothetical protein